MNGRAIARTSEWRAFLAGPGTVFVDDIARLRAEDSGLARDAIRWYDRLFLAAVTHFHATHDRQAMIIRAPGRVNLLGTHIDHRGGRVNPIAVRELVLVVFPREDGRVRIANADPAYPADEFALADLSPDGRIADWADWTLGTPATLRAAGLLGHWSSYIRAALAYFANRWHGAHGLRGFDLYADSELPQAAGLSSSSALVVGSAIAFHLANDRPYDPLALAGDCGQAEWYVGTRGGSGDQAAIALSKAGHVSHVDFFPMAVDWSPWPAGYSVVVAHSRVQAQKTANARSTFNERVATYVIALLRIKQLHPEWAARLVHLRDILRLGLDTGDIYRLLRELPSRAMRDEIRAALPEDGPELEKLFGTHDEPPEGYRVRDVCLYGLAECTRSERLAEHLRAGDVAGAGLLIDLSHEGDRVTMLDEDGERVPIDTGASDADLDGLIAALADVDPDVRAAADLAMQPGGYACSSPAIDEIVDHARGVGGVLGVGLIGAGIGGCVEIIVADEAVEPLREALIAGYYRPRDLEPFIVVARPVEGAGPLRLPG